MNYYFPEVRIIMHHRCYVILKKEVLCSDFLQHTLVQSYAKKIDSEMTNSTEQKPIVAGNYLKFVWWNTENKYFFVSNYLIEQCSQKARLVT